MVLKRSHRFVCVLQSMSVEFRMHTTLKACFGNRTSQLFVIGGIGGGIQQNLTTFIKLKTKNYFDRVSPLLAPFTQIIAEHKRSKALIYQHFHRHNLLIAEH